MAEAEQDATSGGVDADDLAAIAAPDGSAGESVTEVPAAAESEELPEPSIVETVQNVDEPAPILASQNGPPGPPPGEPSSQVPIMRMGAYTAPPIYAPPIHMPPFAGGMQPMQAPGMPMMMPNFPPPLPPGWSEHTAPDGVTRYYYNSQTRESTYVRPSFAPLPNMPPAAPITVAAEKKKKKEKPKEKVPIPGTGWQRITTSEGNVFYFEKETKRSEWTVPDEIQEEVAGWEAEERKLKEEAARLEKEKAEAERLERLKEQERIRAEVEEERKRKLAVVAAKRKAQADAEREKESKKAKTQAGEVDEGADANGNEEDVAEETEQAGPEDEEDEEEWMRAVAAEFAEADQAQQEKEQQAQQTTKLNTEEAAKTIFAVPEKVNVSIDEQRALFKALLTEKDISPFAPWDQSLPSFINDPRYILLSSEKDRREVYEEYCRDVGRARRLKKAGGNNQSDSQKVDPEKEYKTLLREDVTSTRTRWDDFRRKWKKDRRFYAFGRDDRDREKVFKTHLKELGERKRADAQRAELDFYELLREQTDLSSSSKWSEVKKTISRDPRYDAVGSSTLRAELFEGFVRKLASTSTTIAETPEQAADRKLAERKAKQEASLRSRQAQVGAEKERVDREVGKSKAGAGREEGERLFGSLLVDQVRDHETSWNDASRFLSSDDRFNHPALHMGDKRRLFEQHVSRIASKRSNALHDLFAAKTPQLDTPFDDVYPKIIDDPIVQRQNLDVNSLEERWQAWKRQRETNARNEFDQMLGENSFVDFWGKMRKKQNDEAAAKVLENDGDDADEEGGDGLGEGGDRDLAELAKQIDLNEIKSVLRRDQRYRQFDHIPEEREQWIRDYLEGLDAASGSKTIHHVAGGR